MNNSLTRRNARTQAISVAEIGDALVTLKKSMETIVGIIKSADPNAPVSPESLAEIAAVYADHWANACYRLADEK